MKKYTMTYTSNNGDIIEASYTGTLLMLYHHIKALEAYKCHSFFVITVFNGTPVYANNKPIPLAEQLLETVS